MLCEKFRNGSRTWPEVLLRRLYHAGWTFFPSDDVDSRPSSSARCLKSMARGDIDSDTLARLFSGKSSLKRTFFQFFCTIRILINFQARDQRKNDQKSRLDEYTKAWEAVQWVQKEENLLKSILCCFMAFESGRWRRGLPAAANGAQKKFLQKF